MEYKFNILSSNTVGRYHTGEKATPGHHMEYREKVDNRCSKKAVLLLWRDTEVVSYLFSSKTTFHAYILFTGIIFKLPNSKLNKMGIRNLFRGGSENLETSTSTELSGHRKHKNFTDMLRSSISICQSKLHKQKYHQFWKSELYKLD